MTRPLHFTPTGCSLPIQRSAGSRANSMPGSRTCRSSARTGIPIRNGGRPTPISAMRRSCCCTPITMCSECSIRRACRWKRWELAIPRPIRAKAGDCSRHAITCSGAHLRGCGSTGCLPKPSGWKCSWRARLQTSISTRSPLTLATDAFRPRALFERFNIEVIATTESPLDIAGASCCRSKLAAGRAGSSLPIVPIRWSIPSSLNGASTPTSHSWPT